ncbi:MAG: Gfo/Idh/MocA family protein [Armatimonadota bacterium]
MIRIGMAFGAAEPGQTGAFHGSVWAGILNGFDAERAEAEDWPGSGAGHRRLEGARITRLWDPNRERAERMARVFGINTVCDSYEELAEDVDAGLIGEDGRFDKLTYARPFLERGLPTYMDKPLALQADEAREIVAFAAEHNAPLLSCSGWRYCDGAQHLRAQMDEIGGARLLIGIMSMSSFDVYAIHGVEMALGLMGAGVAGVANVGDEGRDIVRLRWEDGRQATLHMYDRSIRGGRRFIVYGPDGHAETADFGEIHPPLLEVFLQMCRTREMPIPAEEMVESVAIVEAIERARETGVEESPA